MRKTRVLTFLESGGSRVLDPGVTPREAVAIQSDRNTLLENIN